MCITIFRGVRFQCCDASPVRCLLYDDSPACRYYNFRYADDFHHSFHCADDPHHNSRDTDKVRLLYLRSAVLIPFV